MQRFRYGETGRDRGVYPHITLMIYYYIYHNRGSGFGMDSKEYRLLILLQGMEKENLKRQVRLAQVVTGFFNTSEKKMLIGPKFTN